MDCSPKSFFKLEFNLSILYCTILVWIFCTIRVAVAAAGRRRSHNSPCCLLPVGGVSRFRRAKWKDTNVFEYPRYLSYIVTIYGEHYARINKSPTTDSAPSPSCSSIIIRPNYAYHVQHTDHTQPWREIPIRNHDVPCDSPANKNASVRLHTTI